MERDLKAKLAQLEAEVAVIKDPALRQIAFGKLLDAAVGAPTSATKTTRSESAAATKKASAATPPSKPKGKNRAAEFYAIAQVRPEVQNLSVSGAVKGLPTLKQCRLSWEKFLWVLAIAKRAGVEGLNNHEIAFLLTKRFYKATKYTGVHNIRLKVEAGFVTPDPETQRWMLTPDGEDHLKGLASGRDVAESK
jgi:hypothetical protein